MEKIELMAENVTISHGKFSVSNVNFKLSNSDIMGLVGRSGAGKSTIIESLTGAVKPGSGRFAATLDGKKTRIRELIGYSPQSNSLYPFLTVEENIKTFGKLYGVKNSDIRARMEFLLRRLDLENASKKRIVQLSGGMQKRADLAVALIHSPRIILLDEPFNGLDISLQRFIWQLLKELSSEGRVIIVSSHMLNDVQKNCNQFGLIEKGIFYGTAQIMNALRTSREKSLEFILENLFAKDMMEEK